MATKKKVVSARHTKGKNVSRTKKANSKKKIYSRSFEQSSADLPKKTFEDWRKLMGELYTASKEALEALEAKQKLNHKGFVLCNTHVTGMQYFSIANVKKFPLTPGSRLELAATTSPYDPTPIKVLLDGVQIGWVPRTLGTAKAMMHKMLSRGINIVAYVRAHNLYDQYHPITINCVMITHPDYNCV